MFLISKHSLLFVHPTHAHITLELLKKGVGMNDLGFPLDPLPLPSSPLAADEPSRCYFHDGDGVCEDFEQKTSILDCGVYTPKGFVDQWASNVTVSHHDERCPGLVVAGQPAANQVREENLPL